MPESFVPFWENPSAVAITLTSDETYTFDSNVEAAGYDNESEVYFVRCGGAETLFAREHVLIFSVRQSRNAEIVELKTV